MPLLQNPKNPKPNVLVVNVGKEKGKNVFLIVVVVAAGYIIYKLYHLFDSAKDVFSAFKKALSEFDWKLIRNPFF